jgi:hypothetical protein
VFFKLSLENYFKFFEIKEASSNIETCFLPLNKSVKAASALIIRLFFLSCNPCFLIYSQVFLIACDLGKLFVPTIAANFADGANGFMKAEFDFCAM